MQVLFAIKRTWRGSGQEVNRQVDMNDISNIGEALNNGWVITFPQGTKSICFQAEKLATHISLKNINQL